MSKKYLVVIPVHKEAYCKSFSSSEKAYELIAEKVGRTVNRISCNSEFSDDAIMFISNTHGAEVNDRATYISNLPDDEDVRGTAVLMHSVDEYPCGYSLEVAEKIRDFINGLRG